jgi:hypothetical protein
VVTTSLSRWAEPPDAAIAHPIVAKRDGTTMNDFAANTLDVLDGWMNMNAVVVRMDEGGYSTCTQNGVERTELDEPCGESDQHEDTDAHERDSEFRSQRMKNARSFLLVVPALAGSVFGMFIHLYPKMQRRQTSMR